MRKLEESGMICWPCLPRSIEGAQNRLLVVRVVVTRVVKKVLLLRRFRGHCSLFHDQLATEEMSCHSSFQHYYNYVHCITAAYCIIATIPQDTDIRLGYPLSSLKAPVDPSHCFSCHPFLLSLLIESKSVMVFPSTLPSYCLYIHSSPPLPRFADLALANLAHSSASFPHTTFRDVFILKNTTMMNVGRTSHSSWPTR